jgi:hypothetical protein
MIVMRVQKAFKNMLQKLVWIKLVAIKVRKIGSWKPRKFRRQF